jgi:hypothetical protein
MIGRDSPAEKENEMSRGGSEKTIGRRSIDRVRKEKN